MLNARDMANAIRFLSIDSVERAKSGHPGMPLGMSDIASALWGGILKHNPKNPSWFNRDRFILSNGHGSMLLYSLLHLTGYDVSCDDLKEFRKIGSKTPGHPEFGVTPGVEATTGPLGQGLANAVGMAICEKNLAKTYNKKDLQIIDHYTYVFVGDGCLMEGISHEVSSLAGTLELSKLIIFWDNNGISIDGKVESWFNESVADRYRSYGFQVIENIDGHNEGSVKSAIFEAQQNTNKPTLICCNTQIGFGSPNFAGTAKVHGSPLGEQEVAATRKNLNWDFPPFVIPDNIMSAWDQTEIGAQAESEWQKLFNEYKLRYPELAGQLQARLSESNNVTSEVESWLVDLQQQKLNIATRKASNVCIDFFQDHFPMLFGGSADLSCSNLTETNKAIAVKDSWNGANYLHFGVREFGMFAIANGMSLYGGFIPFVGTFLTFVDYGKNALRIAAMNKSRVIYILTHDSIGLGEDGPTHQPIEHIAMLRATPGVKVWRPCDMVETAVAWKAALDYLDGPTCLLLSRQSLPTQAREDGKLSLIKKGGYLLYSNSKNIDAIIIATGSEVDLAVNAAKEIKNININVVSMPCMDEFLAQDKDYRDSVLPPHIKCRVAIEAGSSFGWHILTGDSGIVIGLDRYGESGIGADVFSEFGFTVPNIVNCVEKLCISMGKVFNKENGYVD